MGTKTYALSDSAPVPAKGVRVHDPLFGTEIVRITDKAVDRYPDVGIADEYARSDPENSDGTRLVLRGNDGNWQLYDSITLRRIRTLSELGQGGQEAEPRWDAANPSVLYHLHGMRLVSFNVRSGAQRTVHDFKHEFPRLIYISTGSEGDASLDRRYWCFMVENGKSETRSVVMYDRNRNKVIGRLAVKAAINNVSSDVSGRHCVVQDENGDAISYSRTFSRRVRLPAGSVGHSDVARTATGSDVLVYQDNKTDWITMADLDTGSRTQLIEIPFSVNPDIGLHFSGNAAAAPGWVLVSTYGALHPPNGSAHSWMDRQLFMVELRSRPRVWRVAQTHTIHSLMPGGEGHYFAEAFATITARGTHIYWGSNWGQHNLDHTDVYAAILPARWWQQLPAGR